MLHQIPADIVDFPFVNMQFTQQKVDLEGLALVQIPMVFSLLQAQTG